MATAVFEADSRSGVDVYPPLSVHLPPQAPVVVLNHGLTGGSHESYVRSIVMCLTKPRIDGGLGARAAVVNVRYWEKPAPPPRLSVSS